MSDCSNSRCEPYPTLRLRVEFGGGEVPWTYPLALNGREVAGIYVDGVPCVRVRGCGEWRGCPNHEACTELGEREDDELWCEHCDIKLDGEWAFCPRCGSAVRERFWWR